MEISKSKWHINGAKGRISVSVPLTKVDTENRIVSGFATVDNLDLQGHIVTAEASRAAFEKFRGNVREMHQPIAVGRLLKFSTETIYDADADETYTGIYVDVYVSKGAQATWEKVVDGTLSGFSIGGEADDIEEVFDPTKKQMVMVVKSYGLNELSLVDSPGNQLADVYSIVKFDGPEVSSTKDKVFWCASDKIAVPAPDSDDCPICKGRMSYIGWVEKTESELIKANSIKELVKNLTAPAEEEETGGVDMAKENEAEAVAEVVDEVVVETPEVETSEADAAVEETVEEIVEAPVAEEVADEVVAESTETVEDKPVAIDEEKLVEQFRALLDSFIAETRESMSTLTKSIGEVKEGLAEVKGDVGSAKAELNKVAGTVDAVASTTALKKSADVETSSEVTQESLWGGRFTVERL